MDPMVTLLDKLEAYLPRPVWVAGVLFLLALAAIKFFWPERFPTLGAGFAFLVSFIAFGCGLHLWLGIGISPAFAQMHQQVKKLGPPVSSMALEQHAYITVYQHAVVIWLQSTNVHYVLGEAEQKVFAAQVFSMLPDDSPFFNEDYVRKLLDILPDKRPPLGGVAVEWSKNPSRWSWIGGREWQFGVSNKVSIQHFENGIVVGPLPSSHAIEKGWRIFAILKDEWHSRATPDGLTPPFKPPFP